VLAYISKLSFLSIASFRPPKCLVEDAEGHLYTQRHFAMFCRGSKESWITVNPEISHGVATLISIRLQANSSRAMLQKIFEKRRREVPAPSLVGTSRYLFVRVCYQYSVPRNYLGTDEY
jgi:hypothetical protein